MVIDNSWLSRVEQGRDVKEGRHNLEPTWLLANPASRIPDSAAVDA